MPRISILLATLNGARHLDEQLKSIAEQQVDASIDVVASDDGSRDATVTMLADWQGRWSRGAFVIGTGPGRGHPENFRRLVSGPVDDADYVAFADQDDVWMPDKLAVALAALKDPEVPTLYCSRTLIVDERLRPIGRSPHFRRAPHFRNALVQSLAGGNTMVMNAAAHRLVSESARRTSFVSHDWWSYMVISGAGGRVIYDAEPRIAYRQHGANAIGHNTGPRARLIRLRQALSGQFTRWNETNLTALAACRDLLTPEARATLDLFVRARDSGLVQRLYLTHRAGIYRQLSAGNISLALAAILRKF